MKFTDREIEIILEALDLVYNEYDESLNNDPNSGVSDLDINIVANLIKRFGNK